MRHQRLLAFIVTGIVFISCGSSKKETPASIAKKWCELNAKVTQAPDGGPEYGRAKEAREKFEKEMEEKYKSNEAFMKEVGTEVEKCEDASEGR